MSCYHPMIYIDENDMTDPKQRAILETLKIRYRGEDKKKLVRGMLIPRELAISEGIHLRNNKALLVPCGSCIGCRLDYSRQWAERCLHEAQLHDDNYFLTLTYDGAHLPLGSKGVPTLIKDEISAFMKRLRKYTGREGIRFFACGEYGDKGLRPHYHIILFNCPLDDLQERHPIEVDGRIKWIRQYDSNGSPLLFSPLVFKAWQGRGTAQLGQVSYESCAYVARYVVKKLKGNDAKQYADAGVIPPFVRMSRMPGIGYEWYMTNMDHIYEFDNVCFKRGDVVVNQKPGKYCDKLLLKKDEQRFYELKDKRHQDFYDGIDCLTYECVDKADNNRKAEQQKEIQAKALKRGLHI